MENVALCRYFDSRLPGKIPTVLELRVKQDISGIDHATLPYPPQKWLTSIVIGLIKHAHGEILRSARQN